MKSWDIRQRVIFVAALPATFIAVVLAAYFLLLRYADAEKELLDRGHSLIGLLTPAAEYGVFSGNREELQQLAAALSRASDIQSVIIYDGKGFLLAQVGQPNPTLDPEALEDGWSNRSENGDTQYFHAKIWRTALQIDDPLTWAGKARPGKEAIGSIFIAMSRADVLVRKQEMMAVTLIATLVTLGLAALLA